MLVAIDGAKALRKDVQMMFGDRAAVQRCRVHKQRNVVEHLPPEKRQQSIWRLRAAWGKTDWKEAEKELKAVGNRPRAPSFAAFCHFAARIGEASELGFAK